MTTTLAARLMQCELRMPEVIRAKALMTGPETRQIDRDRATDLYVRLVDAIIDDLVALHCAGLFCDAIEAVRAAEAALVADRLMAEGGC